MANKFLKSIASAFIEVKEDTPNQVSQPVNVVPTTNFKPTVSVQTTIPTQSSVSVGSVVKTNENAINSALLDKLCERLESENLPGPDYMELKTAVNDEEMASIIPDESKRFLVAFKSLKANAPSFNKRYVLDSIDKYISLLRQWESEALAEVNNKRNEVSGKKQQIVELNKQIENLRNQMVILQTEVDETENKCVSNENDMKNTVSFLVGKFEEDKNKINMVLND